jgi:hypothetical protein
MILDLILAMQASVVGGVPSPQPTPSALCQVVEVKAAEQGRASPGGADLFVGCGRTAVRLGKAESYQSSYNPGTRSLAVVLHDRGRTRVLMAYQEADGTLQIQDVSRDLAKLSGRPFDAGLRGADVSLAFFAAEGSITVPAAAGQPASGATLNLSRYAAPAPDRAPAPPETPQEASPR